jgi:hypothetical protein
MGLSELVHSYRVIAYFLVDALNWATMDCWLSHETLAQRSGVSSKTVQRSVVEMEKKKVLAVYRQPGSRHPLRYAPVYLPDIAVHRGGHQWPELPDIDVHQSFLDTQSRSFLAAARSDAADKGRGANHKLPSFKLTERGRFEAQLADRIGGLDVLSRLAAVHDDIITRLCEALYSNNLGDNQIRSLKLASKQVQRM